jgi:hypothetical protein
VKWHETNINGFCFKEMLQETRGCSQKQKVQIHASPVNQFWPNEILRLLAASTCACESQKKGRMVLRPHMPLDFPLLHWMFQTLDVKIPEKIGKFCYSIDTVKSCRIFVLISTYISIFLNATVGYKYVKMILKQLSKLTAVFRDHGNL